MTERKYSVSEIEDMRSSLKWLLTPYNVSYSQEHLDAQIEGQLRTYMMAGINPVELRGRAQEHIAAEQAISQAMRDR